MARPKKNAEGKSMPLYTVAIPFQDHRDYMTTPTPQQYEVGDDVSHFDQERLDRAVELGTVQYNGTESTEEAED